MLLLRTQNRVATLERAGSSLNGEVRVSTRPNNLTPKYLPKKKEGICSHKSLLVLVELLIRAKKYLHVMD